MNLENPELSIITIGMNHLDDLKRYLHSLFVTCRPQVSFELIYVDNCSTDQSVNFINDNYPMVRILKNQSIQGFAANNNYGVRKSLGFYILLLNPDVIILQDSVDRLYHFYKSNSKIGILVPQLLNSDLSHQHSVRKFINLRILLFRILYNGRDNVSSEVIQRYLLTKFDSTLTQSVDWALGAAMFFEKRWFKYLHGFDEGYYLYVEDTDICLKSWKLGKPVVYLSNAVLIHAHQRRSNSWNKWKWIHFKSIVRFFVKHQILFKSYDFCSGLLRSDEVR